MSPRETTSPPPVAAEPSGRGVDPREIVRSVVRKRWWILASTLLVGGAVMLGTMRQPKVYQGRAKIIIDPVVPKVLGEETQIDDLSEQTRGERAFYNTQYQIISSRAVLADAAARLRLTEDESFLEDNGIRAATPEERERAVLAVLSERFSVQPEIQSRIVSLVYEGRNADRSAKIVNAIAEAYIQYNLERRMAMSRTASKWLDERVEEFRAKIEAQERALAEFQQKKMLVESSLEERQNMASTGLSRIAEKLVDNQTKLIELESRKRVLVASQGTATATVAELAMTLDRYGAGASIATYKNLIADLRAQRAQLSTRYGERHPNMVGLDRQIAEAEAQLGAELRMMQAALDKEIEAARAQESSLRAAMADEKSNALEINGVALEYQRMARDLGTDKRMYELLLKRQTEASLNGLLESNFVRVHETAEPSPIPVRPSVPKNTAIGLVVGLLLGLGVAVGAVLLDNTVHSQAEIEELLRLPFLGVFPRIDADAPAPKRADGTVYSSDRDLYIVRNSKSTVAECARSIRTNLLFMSTDKPLHRLLVTSAGPYEGKSTTAIALSVAMAQAGNRVLLIDTDLRRPRLHRAFGVSGERGITSLLLDDQPEPETAIKRTEVVGLDLLPCGPLPPNPAELLHTERFLALAKLLGERYDRLVFDSPPVHAVTDAVILAQLVDGVVVVAKAAQTTKDGIRRAARKLYDVDANLLGVVLNDVDFDQGGYGGYYYYQRYGYAYGADADKPS
jgi:succinoglycan biosynthesis transport protein ExoP